MPDRPGVSYGKKPRPDGRWQGYVVLTGGKRRTVIRPTEAEMRAEVDRLADQRDQGREPGTTDPTVLAYLTRYMADRRDGIVGTRPLAPASVVKYERLIRLKVAPYIGTVRMSRVGAGHVDRVMDGLRETGESSHGRQQVYRLLAVAFKHAQRRGLLSQNPCMLVDVPQREKHRVRDLSTEDLAAVLVAARNDPREALLWLGVATGARIGELLALWWTDIDLDGAAITIRRAVQLIPGAGSVVSEPKTEAGIRTMALPAVAVAALRNHRARQDRDGRPNPLGLVFPSSRGTYVNEANWRRDTWEPWKQAAGIDPKTPFRQVARKAHASLLVALGTDPETLRHRSGHTSAVTTFTHYVQTVSTADREAAKKLDAALRKLAAPPKKRRRRRKSG
jgi:integrase